MGMDGGTTRPRSTMRLNCSWMCITFSLSFRVFLFPRLFLINLLIGPHSGMDTTRKLGARMYKGIPRWSLLMIVIPVLNTRMQLVLGNGMLNSLICLWRYLYTYALMY